jgi:hypothetical protein
MKLTPFSRVLTGAKSTLTAMAIVAVLGLVTPSAFASINLSYSVSTAGSTTQTGSGTGFLSVGGGSIGNFGYSITANTTDPAGGTGTSPASYSSLSTTTFSINNDGSSTHTIDVAVSGSGFTVGTNDVASFSVSGSSSHYNILRDTTTDTSSINSTAIPPSGGLTGTPVSNGSTTTYSWTSGGNSSNLAFTNSSTFSIAQLLAITLGAGDSATLTINTSVTSTPEPSTMAIAGLGALGMIGYGLRRRKAKGA